MAFLAATISLFSAFANGLKPRHSWHYDTVHGLRTCTCCGRQEEMIVDLVSSDWQMLVAGDQTAHASKSAAVKPAPKTGAELLAARSGQTPS